MVDKGANFFEKIYRRVVLCGGTNDQIRPSVRKDVTNAFSSNLNTVNLNIFPKYGGI